MCDMDLAIYLAAIFLIGVFKIVQTKDVSDDYGIIETEFVEQVPVYEGLITSSNLELIKIPGAFHYILKDLGLES